MKRTFFIIIRNVILRHTNWKNTHLIFLIKRSKRKVFTNNRNSFSFLGKFHLLIHTFFLFKKKFKINSHRLGSLMIHFHKTTLKIIQRRIYIRFFWRMMTFFMWFFKRNRIIILKFLSNVFAKTWKKCTWYAGQCFLYS